MSHLVRFYSSSIETARKRLVILGSGWAGFTLLRNLDQARYKVAMVSPRNYFVFTPLLASTCVGTLEFRCITEPVQKHARYLRFYDGTCIGVDFEKQCVVGERHVVENEGRVGKESFQVDYDTLVIACGAVTQTFNIPGVREHAFFLKDIQDARKIRFRVIECFERANQPDMADEKRRALLNFATVGGGPTGVEFSAELHDFITEDMARLYPHLMSCVQMELFDVAPAILTNFDSRLSEYATKRFDRDGIQVRTGTHVEKIDASHIYLKDGEKVPVGLVVWATGLAPNPLVTSLNLPLDPGKRIMVDDHLRVLSKNGEPFQNVFALGDCAAIKGHSLPSTAQVAKQEAVYLAKN